MAFYDFTDLKTCIFWEVPFRVYKKVRAFSFYTPFYTPYLLITPKMNPTAKPIKCAYQAIGSPIKSGATEIIKIQVIIPFLWYLSTKAIYPIKTQSAPEAPTKFT